MTRRLWTVGGLLAGLLSAWPLAAQERPEAEQQAIQALKEKGARIKFDESKPGKPVVGIGFGIATTDADLKHLKEFKGLEWLNLGETQVTDAGLKELKDLRSLQVLFLYHTQITGAGLKEFKSLKELDLTGSQISDAGLEELKDLKNLRQLYLRRTLVTDAGVADLQKALPKLNVIR